MMCKKREDSWPAYEWEMFFFIFCFFWKLWKDRIWGFSWKIFFLKKNISFKIWLDNVLRVYGLMIIEASRGGHPVGEIYEILCGFLEKEFRGSYTKNFIFEKSQFIRQKLFEAQQQKSDAEKHQLPHIPKDAPPKDAPPAKEITQKKKKRIKKTGRMTKANPPHTNHNNPHTKQDHQTKANHLQKECQKVMKILYALVKKRLKKLKLLKRLMMRKTNTPMLK